MGFTFELPSNLPSRFYWVKSNTGSSLGATEKGGRLRSHVMHETYRQKRQEDVSARYSTCTPQKRRYKRLAPKDVILTPSVSRVPNLDFSTK
jgi:hypothetical protein